MVVISSRLPISPRYWRILTPRWRTYSCPFLGTRGYTLDESSWHADLLNKMRLHGSHGRGPVLADDTFRLLNELRSFRHFKRHNYKRNYDWKRLDALCDTFRTVIPLVKRDLAKVQLLLGSIPPQGSAPEVANDG